MTSPSLISAVNFRAYKSLPHGETSFAVRCAGLRAHHSAKMTLPLKGCSYASCAAILSTRLMVQHNLLHDASSFLSMARTFCLFNGLNTIGIKTDQQKDM